MKAWLVGSIVGILFFGVPSFFYFSPFSNSLGFIFWIPLVIVGFFIGTFLGWLIGKIKS